MTERDPTHLPRLVLRIAALSALAFSGAALIQYTLPTPTFCAPGGGCDLVRLWADRSVAGVRVALLLPVLGVFGFLTLFAGSLIAQPKMARITAVLAMIGGAVGLALISLQALAVGAWCWLCVGVDGSAIVAGVAGAVLFARAGRADPKASARLRSPYWAGVVLALFAPLAWAFTLPDPDLPRAVLELYRPGAVNVVEVVDFECPYCRRLHPVLKRVLSEVDGDVNLVRVILPLSFHVHARGAAAAYHCAGREGRSEAMADRLFAAEDLSRAGLFDAASAVGLDAAAFEACLDDPAIEARIVEDEALATRSGNRGLPTVYIGDRTMLGFDERTAEATLRDAVQAAKTGAGARTRIWWPMGLVVLLALGVLVLSRERAPKPEDPQKL